MLHKTLVGRPSATPRPKHRRSDAAAAVGFLLPALCGFALFSLIPTVRSIWLSFTNASTLSAGNWVGGANYARLVKDPLLWNGLKVTLAYVIINIGTQTIAALALAFILDRFARNPFWRQAILLPWLIPGVTVSLLWMWLLDPSLGLVNGVTEALGLGSHGYFADSHMAIATVALVNTWRYTGYQALLLLAGMQNIERTYYEAAAVDGAGEWRMFTRVTMPLLRPVLALVLIMSTIGSFQIFDTVSVATQGGPSNATNVIYYYILQRAFASFDLGYASALAVVVLIILIILTLAQMRLLSTDGASA